MDTSVIIKAIEKELSSRDENQAWLCRQLEITSQVYNNWRNRGIPTGRLTEIANLFDWDIAETLAGNPGPKHSGIPLLGASQVFEYLENSLSDSEIDQARRLLPNEINSIDSDSYGKRAFAYFCTSNEHWRQDMVLVIDPDLEPLDGVDAAYELNGKGRIQIGTYIDHGKNGFIRFNDNSYQDIHIDENSHRYIGRIIRFWGGFDRTQKQIFAAL